MANEALQHIIQSIPQKPGVYQYYDNNGKILYVGKAKNLKKRVSSYFQKEHDSGKTRVLVKKIADIKTIVVDSEMDALLLENNLIKEYQPRYNVMLRDDKTYPWICIKNERFPRVFSTRRLIKDGSEYYGPYASAKMANTVLELIHQLFPLRNCNFDLSEKNIESGKFKVCLEYHIGNCLGPCEGKQTGTDYDESITQIRNIVKGNISVVTKHLKELMKTFAENLQFEEAQQVKEKVELLERYQAKSTIVNPKINNIDVFSVVSDNEYGYVNFLSIVNGAIIQSHTIEMKKKLEEADEELLMLGITELRQRFNSQSKEIYLSKPLDIDIEDIKLTVPKIGDKRQLVELSIRNAHNFRQERFKQSKIIDPERHSKRILEQMQKDLRLSEKPAHIECFDNSNIQGTNPVAACVVFKNAKPSKKDYRHFNIKTVEGPDDFASMEEVVYRRYKRLKEEEQPLPQLIVIDGGKGQLSSAVKSLDKLGLRGKIAIIGIAKRLEELYYPNDPLPLYLDKKSETLKVIQQLRNEAHRFGIEHHRNRRSKASIKSALEEIPGVGQATINDLLKAFKSVKRVKEASEEELKEIVGLSKAKKVYSYFNS